MIQTRQEEAYNFIANNFIELVQKDKKLAYDYKRSLLAFLGDAMADENVMNDLLQAISNFLWEIDKKIDSSRKAGMIELKDAIRITFNPNGEMFKEAHLCSILALCDSIVDKENTPDEPSLTDDEVSNMDLSEVGGGDEDDSPLY